MKHIKNEGMRLKSEVKAGKNCCSGYSGGGLSKDYINDAAWCCVTDRSVDNAGKERIDCFAKVIRGWWTC